MGNHDSYSDSERWLVAQPQFAGGVSPLSPEAVKRFRVPGHAGLVHSAAHGLHGGVFRFPPRERPGPGHDAFWGIYGAGWARWFRSAFLVSLPSFTSSDSARRGPTFVRILSFLPISRRTPGTARPEAADAGAAGRGDGAIRRAQVRGEAVEAATPDNAVGASGYVGVIIAGRD
jgi:hypothetical protein